MTSARTKRSPQDLVAGGMFLVCGLIGIWGSSFYPMGTALQMGPGYFPALVFGVMAALGAVILAKGLVTAGPGIEGRSWRPVAVILGALTVFALAATPLGFVVSSAGLVLIATAATDGHSLTSRLTLAGVLTAFCWALFVLGLGVLIPTWPWFLQ
ncbi:MAG: tripartite tricarboxylate transporter TctB family protein [Alphaproteobacteria bacterium]|nr:tripartite tricarboxylate transporter TctB family protein [Alphaproteobacteria bacterium]